jgi:prophage tail gpP-like protein
MNIKIDHRLGVVDVSFFNKVNINLKYDSVASTFGVEFYFDPKNADHAEMACVSHYHECIISHKGYKLLTGYVLSNSFSEQSKKTLTKIGGYSKPGVFEDCDIPTSLYPLQVDGLTLREITQKIIAPFDIALVVDGVSRQESNQAFTLDEQLDKKIEKTNAKESQNIKSYLTDLAIQRNVVLSHTVNGDLLFTEAKTNQEPLFHVEKGVIATKIGMTFNGQGVHSQIEVLKQPDSTGGDGGKVTIYNPYCPIVFRPKVVVQSSGDINTLEDFAKQVLASELKNIVVTVEIDRWDVYGIPVMPNNIITIKSPENYIYETTEFFIQEVSMVGDSESETAILTCVLPEVYNKQVPKNVFVDVHANLPRI